MKRTLLYAPRVKGDLDLGTEPTRNGANAHLMTGGGLIGTFQDINQISAVQNYVLGTKINVDDSIFRYVLAGGTTLANGKLVQSPVPDSTHIDLVPTANFAIGVSTFTLTNGVNPIAANQYAGGYLYVATGTGHGQTMRIVSNTAAANGATVTVVTRQALAVATDNTSRFSLLQNKYQSLIVVPATGTYQNPQTAKALGVPLVPITNGYYGWVCTRGPAALLTTGTVYIGNAVEPDPANAGAVVASNYRFATGSAAAGDVTLFNYIQDSTETPGTPSPGAVGVAADQKSTVMDWGRIPTPVGHVLRVEVTTQYSLVDLNLE